MRRRTALTRLAVAATITATVALTDPGSALAVSEKPQPYTGQQICGSGYDYLQQQAIIAVDGTGDLLAKIQVFVSHDKKKLCAVTLKTKGVGTPSHTLIAMWGDKNGSSYHGDQDDYTYYAGPVFYPSGPSCVDVYGEVHPPQNGGATRLFGVGIQGQHCTF